MMITRSKLDRLYDEYWTPEIFTIRNRFRRDGLNIYTVEDKLSEPVKGTFYESELQKVRYDPDGVYRIEKVIKKRKQHGVDHVLIKWYGWPAKFNSWINKDQLINFNLVT